MNILNILVVGAEGEGTEKEGCVLERGSNQKLTLVGGGREGGGVGWEGGSNPKLTLVVTGWQGQGQVLLRVGLDVTLDTPTALHRPNLFANSATRITPLLFSSIFIREIL